MSTLFTYAFRPLFLLATFYAIVIVPYWVAAWLGAYSMPVSLGSPLWWHAHEMIHGFAGAAVGGFALTAVATWTKRPPVAGVPLIVLSSLWLAARILFVWPYPGIRVLAMSADLAYAVMLFVLMRREVVSARNQRNYKVLAILALLPVTNALFFVGLSRTSKWTMTTLVAGLWLVVLLINLIGGRIIPTFTRNWLRRHAQESASGPDTLPPAFDRLDLLATWLLVGFAALDVGGAPPSWLAALGAATGGVLLIRLYRWQGRRALRDPLVWVLHLGFVWIPIGVLLLSAAALGLVPRSAGIHALTAGAMTTMIVAVASRAALGHTGRPLRSHPLLTASYVLITVAAVARVMAAAGWGARPLLMASATTWVLSFVCFAWRFTPILTQPRQTSARSLPIL
jgi:uncharacterized protein involved in response to NO